MTTIAFVFARGGSRGVPRKNLRTVGGIPLLGIAIQHAQAATLVDRVIVSTEDAEIAAVARSYGAEVLDRPAELATDDAPEWLCWQHAVEVLGMGLGDTFASVPCTAPLRVPGDVDAVIRALRTPNAYGAYGAIITVTPSRRSPFFNIVKLHSTGFVYLASYEHAPCATRQDAPATHDVTTVAYAARPDYILKESRLMMPGQVGAVVVPPERALDIDSELDLRIAEALMHMEDAGYWRVSSHVAGIVDAVSDVQTGGKGKVVLP